MGVRGGTDGGRQAGWEGGRETINMYCDAS